VLCFYRLPDPPSPRGRITLVCTESEGEFELMDLNGVTLMCTIDGMVCLSDW